MLRLLHANQREAVMKMAFVVYYEHVDAQVMGILDTLGIDYYTRWEHLKGKGHGTEPHIGLGTYQRMNFALMIAFEDEAPLKALIDALGEANKKARRPDERIRLFQLPLERIV
jgi:hypothetical protein